MRRVVASLLLVGSAVNACGQPVPEGYKFPTRSVGSSGAAALLTGTVVARNGCLYVMPEAGSEYLVVWPDDLRLVIDPVGVPLIMNGSTEVARVGSVVRIGGGERAPDLPGIPDCPGPVWDGSEVVPPEE